VQLRGLWGDLLPVVANLSPAQQRKVANLAILRDEAAILPGILRAADADDLWRIVLPLVEMFDEPMRDACAGAALDLAPEAMARAAQATLVGELWEPMLDLVRRMPQAKQAEFAVVLKSLAGFDPALDRRVIARAEAHGLGAAMRAAGLEAA
jgi:hypothetical protein